MVALGRPADGITLLLEASARRETPKAKASIAAWLAVAHGAIGDLHQARAKLDEATRLYPACAALARARRTLRSETET